MATVEKTFSTFALDYNRKCDGRVLNLAATKKLCNKARLTNAKVTKRVIVDTFNKFNGYESSSERAID